MKLSSWKSFVEVSLLKTDQCSAFTTKLKLEVCQLLISIYRFTNSDFRLQLLSVFDRFFFVVQCGFCISVLSYQFWTHLVFRRVYILVFCISVLYFGFCTFFDQLRTRLYLHQVSLGQNVGFEDKSIPNFAQEFYCKQKQCRQTVVNFIVHFTD